MRRSAMSFVPKFVCLFCLASILMTGVQAQAAGDKELVPGINACLKKAKDMGNPASPNFAGMGEAREATYGCYDKALKTVDKELRATVQAAKQQCQKKSGEDFGIEIADCRKRYDTFLQAGLAYRDATRTMLEMYWAGCPTCNFSDTVENAVRETKRQIGFVKRAASNYADEIK